MRQLLNFKYLLKKLPQFLRYKIQRKNLVVPRLIKGEFDFKLATTDNELEQAYALLHNSYVSEGYMKPSGSGLRYTLFHALPGSAVLIAKKKDQVIATVTLIKDSPMGLPSDKDYFTENEIVREQGFHLCEVSALAIDPKFRSGLITFHLIKYLWHYATDVLDIDMLCCVINPKALDFYKAFLNFTRNGPEISYDFVEGAKGLHITRDLRNHKQWMKQNYNHLPMKANLYHFFYEEPSDFYYPKESPLKFIAPTFTKETFTKFFNGQSEVLKNATPNDVALIKSAYSLYFDFPSLSPTKDSELSTRDSDRPYRYTSSVPAFLYNKEVAVMGRITDFGTHGLFFHTTTAFDMLQKYEITFSADNQILTFEVEPRWKTPASTQRHAVGYGLRFTQPPERLHSLLKKLHQKTTSETEQ